MHYYKPHIYMFDGRWYVAAGHRHLVPGSEYLLIRAIAQAYEWVMARNVELQNPRSQGTQA